MPILTHRLDNGLTVLLEPNPAAHTAALGYFVRTGARDEEPALMGVSHFLEHMMFKGTATRSGDDINRAFDAMGADYNAWTGHEATAYHAHILPEFLPATLDLLSDMLRPALRAEDFEMERKVILEEIGMYDDKPEWRLSDTLIESHYGPHGLGFRVLGTNETVGRMQPGEMRAYFERRYAPDNMVVSAAGKFDPDQLLAAIEERTRGWLPSGVSRRDNRPPGVCGGTQKITDARCSRHYVGCLYDGPSIQSDARYAARVLSSVLGDDDGSRLYWALIDSGLADEADFSACPQDGCGTFTAYAACPPERAEKIEAILRGEIEDLATGKRPLEVDELARATSKLATGATLQDERPAGRMQAMGVQWTALGHALELKAEVERIKTVTAGEVAAVAKTLQAGPQTVVRLGP